MPLYDRDQFVKDFVTDLKTVQTCIGKLQIRYAMLSALVPEERKAVTARVGNNLIDIPLMPEYIELMLISTGVEFFEYLIKKKFKKEEVDESHNPT